MENIEIVKKANKIAAIVLALGIAISIILPYWIYLSEKNAGFKIPAINYIWGSFAFLVFFYIIMQAIRAFYLKENYIGHIYLHGMTSAGIAIVLAITILLSDCVDHPMCEIFAAFGFILSMVFVAIFLSILSGAVYIIKRNSGRI